MNRSPMMTVSRVVFLGVLVAAGAVGTLLPRPAAAQVEVVIEPPAEFIATTAPVYFEGRAAYWWNGRWYYREGRDWRWYHDEPVYLRDWRGRREPERHYYGREHDGGYYHREWGRRR